MKKINKTIEAVCDYVITLANEAKAERIYAEELAEMIAECVKAVAKLVSARTRSRMALGLMVAGIIISAIVIIVSC